MPDTSTSVHSQTGGTPSGVLLQLFERQYDYLCQIAQSCESQKELVETGDLTALMRLLSQKNRPVDELRRCAAEIRSVTAGAIDWQPDAARDTVLALRSKCDQLGERVLELESECERLLIAERESTSSLLSDLNQRIAVAGAYQAHGDSGGSGDPVPAPDGAFDSQSVTVHPRHPSGAAQIPNTRGGNLDLQSE